MTTHKQNQPGKKVTPKASAKNTSSQVLNKTLPNKTTAQAPSKLHIVGIGASAGGLEALELFLKSVPQASGLAFVVVQHLDPTYKGILVELLQRATSMPVLQIQDRMQVQADHVYVIPPNTDLSILHGVLHLLEPIAPRGLRLPIDFFFRSLADDQQENAIGVILSGMGSDGTLGLRAIKEKAGAVFVQDPTTATFDGMPSSAINAGLADIIASAQELVPRIANYVHHVPLLANLVEADIANKDHSALEKVILILRALTGHDFSLYKKSTMYRRIERRISLHELLKINDYVRYLRENPKEAELLFKELLIGVTNFFRDAEVWEQLKNETIPLLLKAHPQGGTLRAWVPACSTGEEAYTLGMIFREALDLVKPTERFSLQIFATDLDRDAIDKARAGNYLANIEVDVTEKRLRRFFTPEEHGYKVIKEIREMVIFAPQNLVMDPPFTKLDILTCRNLLIYLEPNLQKKLLPLFHFSLNKHGILVLGSSETVGQSTDLFSAMPGKTRIYRRQENVARLEHVEFPTAYSGLRTHSITDGSPPLYAKQLLSEKLLSNTLEQQTDALLLQQYAPAAVLTNIKGDIVYISGKTGRYLEPAAGKANLNIFAMARQGLAGPLSAAFAKAVRQKIKVTLNTVEVQGNTSHQSVNVTLQPLFEPVAMNGMVLIVFADVPMSLVQKTSTKAALTKVQLAQLDMLTQELQQSHEELQSTREEMQSSQEELKSANEELQSANEELQSTNEELTTSKEEMQSMNEELHSLNYELQARVDEFSRASDDMENLLNSTNIATLFLDGELRVRRFTNKITSLINLIATDVGRLITDLSTELAYPELVSDARKVLVTLIFTEREVVANDGRWFMVRIMPYRTETNRIDGVVITFLDITDGKVLENSLRDAMAVLEKSSVDQDLALDSGRTLDEIIKAAQSVLESRVQHGRDRRKAKKAKE